MRTITNTSPKYPLHTALNHQFLYPSSNGFTSPIRARESQMRNWRCKFSKFSDLSKISPKEQDAQNEVLWKRRTALHHWCNPGNRSLGDVKAEHEKLTVNPRCSPSRILCNSGPGPLSRSV